MTRFSASAYTCRQFVNIKPHENENEIRMSDTQQAAQGLVHNPSLPLSSTSHSLRAHFFRLTFVSKEWMKTHCACGTGACVH